MQSLKNQTGDFLIEAMVGTLITALVSLGTLAISTRVMLTQAEMVRQETIVATLREKLHNHTPNSVTLNQCTAAAAGRTFSLPSVGQVSYTVSCPARAVNYSIGGQNYVVNLPMADMSVTVPATNAIYTLGAG